MESYAEVPVSLSLPVLNFFFPESRIFLPYLAGALVMAFLVYLARGAEGALPDDSSTRHRFLGFCFPRRVYGHESAVVDYKYYLINGLLRAFGLFPVLIGVPLVAELTGDWLGHHVDPLPEEVGGSLLLRALFTLAMLLAFDLGVFVAHYLQHRVPVLWEFHKVHHSARVLTPITLYRMHPVDDLLTGACTALLMGPVVGAFSWWTGGTVVEVLVGGVNVELFLFYFLGYNLRHSEVWLAYPRWLSWLLVNPAQHQIHRSSAPVHFERNLGFVFSFWDRMARTLYVPVERESLDFGLGKGQDDEYDGVVALYLLPFRKVAGRLFRRLAAGSRNA